MKTIRTFLTGFVGIIACCAFALSGAQAANPFADASGNPYAAPAFDRITYAQLEPALERGIAEYKANIASIRAIKPRKATFQNVILALDAADSTLGRVNSVSGYLRSNFSNDSLTRILVATAPRISELYDGVRFDPAIFRLIKTVYDKRHRSGLDSLQLRTLDKVYKGYVRSGALCTPAQQKRVAEINAELSVLRMRHGDNIVQETESYICLVSDSTELAGLSQSTRNQFARRAEELGKPGQWAIGLTNGDYSRILSSAENRSLRERLWRAYTTRCNRGGAYDNKELSTRIVDLRRERAQILGYDTYSDLTLETNMAKSPEKVYELLLPLLNAAIAKSGREMEELTAFAAKREGPEFELKPWDRSYYSGLLRREVYDARTNDVNSYLPFDRVSEGVFDVAGRLFGFTFTQRNDIPVYHPDVLVYEVFRDQKPCGLLYLDCFVRPGKRGGAWCSRMQGYSLRNGVEKLPLVTISCNFARPEKDKPLLLSTSSVNTFFHEMGHALAGFCARGPYPQVTGNFPRDMVELPSQILENWGREPEVMRSYARHYKTGEPIPDELLARIKRAEGFQQGLETIDAYASSLLDLEWHNRKEPLGQVDIDAFEQEFLQRYGFPEYTNPRYRTTYFNHIFASSYPSQYYVYTWAAVLETDAYSAFTETGNIFDPQVAERFRKHILTEVGYDEADKQYIRFRGEMPGPEALQRRLGLDQ